MKGFIVFVIAVVAVLGTLQSQNAQKLVGTWQGALKVPNAPNGQLRLVIQVSQENDRLKAVFYSIDQRSPAIPASTFTSDGSTVKMTIAALNATYEGKLGADGNSINGSWSQGGPAAPLEFDRATPQTAWALPEAPAPPTRMAANADPAFEVATIKPSDPARPGKAFTVRGVEVITINTTLSDLITTAYDLHPKQITGGPSWMESSKYDITGKPDVNGQPNVAQMKVMFQKLLSDRFQLKFHREKKEQPVYALTVMKNGPKFAKSERDPDSLPGLFFRPPGTNLNVTNATMSQFASLLQSTVLDKPVVDQTGLADKYDFILKWTPDQGQLLGLGGAPPPPSDPGDAPPDLFTAIQQQLGLKLDSTRAPADVFIIDRVERPSDN